MEGNKTPHAENDVEKERQLPNWLLAVLSLCVVSMASQTSLPLLGGRLTLADLGIATAFPAMLFYLWRSGRRLYVPAIIAAALLAYCLTNLAVGSGRTGAMESAQRVEQLFCGFLIFALFLSEKPRWITHLIGISLLANVTYALIQTGNQGFGPTMTGFFQSRMSLSFYLAVTLAWIQPFWLENGKRWFKQAGTIIATALVLGCIAHGQMLLLAIVVLMIMASLHSTRAIVLNLTAVCLLVISLGISKNANRADVLTTTLSPFGANGEIKQAHTEVVAAMRLGLDHPLLGIGAGNYQKSIGTYYRELPNPPVNAIEQDTQSGLGIMLGTVGFPTSILFMLVLLVGLGQSLRKYYSSTDHPPVSLAGPASACVLLGGLMISDPFVRGLGWFVALSAASLYLGRSDNSRPAGKAYLGYRGILACGALFALPILALLLMPTHGSAKCSPGKTDASVSGQISVHETVSAPDDATTGAAVPADVDFFKVIDAADAKEFTAPFILAQDEQAGRKTILRIPDGTGKPPENDEPSLKYGGAVFELNVTKATQCNIWLRVWWEGSCGNSLYVKTPGNSKPMAVGNDGTYNVWQWLRVPGRKPYQFAKGTHQLLILNREDGIRMDQILLTGDLQYVPQGVEQE